MVIMVDTGRRAENSVLIRNAEAIEILHKADTLVVDKTGTLTEGKPRLAAIELPGRAGGVNPPVLASNQGFDTDELLRLAASLERGSEHPLAAAIVSAAEAKGLPLV